MNELQKKLAIKQIYPALTEKVMYRYSYKNILIDFIPCEKTPLGPTNSWLKFGFQKAYSIMVGGIEIKILKWEPKVSFEQGVKKTVEWYKEKHKLVGKIDS